MRHVVTSLLLVLGACGAAEWVDVVSEDGGFSVRMPGEPTVTTRSVDTDVGAIPMRVHIVERAGFAFMVSFADYPDAAIEASTPERMLDGARDGAAANIQGEVIEERTIHLGELPGRFVVVRSEDEETLVQMRLYLVGSRLYQVGVVTPRDEPTSEEVTAFFESLTLAGASGP